MQSYFLSNRHKNFSCDKGKTKHNRNIKAANDKEESQKRIKSAMKNDSHPQTHYVFKKH